MSPWKSWLGAAAGVAAGAVLVAASALLALESPQEEKQLLGTLESSAPHFEKAKACQRLAVIGTKEAVPALAKLLASDELAHYARFALEPIPDPAVDEALREAVGKLKGKLLIGAINSLGARRDAKAVPQLLVLLRDPESEIAAAAAAALGRIGDLRATTGLKEALAGAAAPLQSAIAEACLACAETRLAAGEERVAAVLYGVVEQADLQAHLRLAALRGRVLAEGAASWRLLAPILVGGDYGAFAVGLSLAREVKGSEATQAIANLLPSLAPERQVLAIEALGDRGDPAALPALLSLVKEGPAPVRVAAVGALKSLGEPAALPALLEAGAGAESTVAEAAREALGVVGGKKVDEAILRMLEASEPAKRRLLLLEVAGRRRLAAAVPLLSRAAEDQDETVRLAAIQALGETVRLADLSLLTGRLAAGGAPLETTVLHEALKAACRRLPDRDACADKLVGSMSTAPLPARVLMLDVFNSIGGARALEAVSAHMLDPNDGLREAAARVLSEWRSEEAAVELLKLAKAATDPKERARALGGFHHIVRRLGFPKEERLGLSKEALESARNDDERKQVIETLAHIPASETLAMLAPLFLDAALKEEAGAAAVRVAERAVRFQPAAVAAAMKQVLETTAKEELAARARKVLEQAGGKQ